MKKELLVLLVEDNADDAALIKRALLKSDFKPAMLRVETPGELREALVGQEWDVVLSDYNLPALNGLDALEIVLQLRPDLPFLLVSGVVGDETAVQLMKTGARDFIIKDRLSRLGPAVHRELKEARVRREKDAADQAFEALVKGMAGATGYHAFDNIINGVCDWLHMEHGLVGELLGDGQVSTHSVFLHRKKVDNFSYSLEGTPCSKVLTNGAGYYPENVSDLFPSHHNLDKLAIAGYVGVPLLNNRQEPFGILCFFSSMPLEAPERLFNVMDMVAVKAATEIERLRTEESRNRLEEQLRQAQKMEAIGTLAGGIAHDFNNILTAIIGYSELVDRELDHLPDARRKIREVVKAGGRAKDLARQILTFSRKGAEEREPLRIHLLVLEALKLLRASTPSTIDFQVNISNDCGMVLADPSGIHQVVMNLCTNSYHAMTGEGGGLTVSLDSVVLQPGQLAEYHNDGGTFVRLTVRDTGHGISPDILEKIFDPYFTTKPQEVGTGLGLSMVHGIVKSHGGHITVESEVGKGTCFSVYLPTVEEEVILEVEPQVFQDIPRGNENIMVVDDEEMIVQFTAEILQSLGYKVITAYNGQEALDKFLEDPDQVDLIITDMTMPKMAGTDLAKEVFAIRPKLPIILCTGHSDMVNSERAWEIGIREYRMKPVSGIEMANLVRKILDDEKSD